MSILQTNFRDVPPAVVITAGEKLLRIASVKEGINVNKKPYLAITMECLDEPDADNMFHMLYLPDGEDAGKDRNKTRFVNKFCLGFKVPFEKDGGLDVEKMLGCESYVIVKHGQDQNGETRAEVDTVVGGK